MNKIIIIVLIVVILGIIVGFGVDLGLSFYRFNKVEENTHFPPWPSICPDYWQHMGDNVCRNVHKLGDCKSGESDNDMSFNETIFQGARGMYYKCNWAKQCKVPWEGVDNLC